MSYLYITINCESHNSAIVGQWIDVLTYKCNGRKRSHPIM